MKCQNCNILRATILEEGKYLCVTCAGRIMEQKFSKINLLKLMKRFCDSCKSEIDAKYDLYYKVVKQDDKHTEQVADICETCWKHASRSFQ